MKKENIVVISFDLFFWLLFVSKAPIYKRLRGEQLEKQNKLNNKRWGELSSVIPGSLLLL
jgi:hypothetical protein